MNTRSILHLLFALLLLLNCASSNMLREYSFEGKTVSDRVSAPFVRTIIINPYLLISSDNEVGSAARIGTKLIDTTETELARSRIDSAAAMINIPGRFGDEVANGIAGQLKLYRIIDKESTDFALELEIEEFGIDARSWTSTLFFVIKVKAILSDNRFRKNIWETTEYFHEPVTFGLNEKSVTAISLAEVSSVNITAALESFTDNAAARIVEKLKIDYTGIQQK